jgi:uncharacterized protein YndB with AHSA1/START domain
VNRQAIVAVLGIILPIAAEAQSAWVGDQTVQQQLAAGEVAVQILFDGDESRMHVRAAVRINASPETIWAVLTDCEHAASFIPGVKRCRRVQTAADDSWEIIEQETRYSRFMPSVTCTVRSDYKRPQRIDFKRVSGDLKDETGEWLLVPQSQRQGDATLVEYELYVDPGFWIPRVLLRHSLRAELPAALTGLRTRSEGVVTAK